jgi:hypothetical protein
MFETTNQVIFVTYIVVRVLEIFRNILDCDGLSGKVVFLSSLNASYNSVIAHDWLL